MPDPTVTVWSVFVAGALSVGILLAAFLAALVIAQKRRIAQEREHAQRILVAQEEERSRVARELHDDALQRIAVILHELEEAVQLPGPELAHRIAGVSGELDDLAVVLRSAAHQLHPSVVEKAGLSRALAALAQEYGRTAGLHVRFTHPDPPPALPPAVGVAAYRIAQEALRNVFKHAGTLAADVTLSADGGGAVLRIADTGRGFDSDAGSEAGLGLIAMRQRAEAVGGRLTVTARMGGGTVVTATFPRQGVK